MKYLVMAGIDYEHSTLQVREKAAFTESKIKNAFNIIKQDGILNEAVIVSTCNRSEIYAVSEKLGANKYIKDFCESFFNMESSEIKDNLVIRNGFDVVYHIFKVANGFKSMVLGEDQILGQVKEGYKNALINKASGKILNRLFLNAITNAKKVKTNTSLTNTSVSVSGIGVKLIKKHIKTLNGKRALLIGIGKMSRLNIKYLLSEGIDKIYITNRTRKKILDLEENSDKICGLDFEDRYKYINDVDVIISCTSAPHFILHAEDFTKNYKGNPLCILDLAVPRDVEPQVGNVSGTALYVIDDIKKITEENEKIKHDEYNKGMKYLREDVLKYINWLEHDSIDIDGCTNVSREELKKEVLA